MSNRPLGCLSLAGEQYPVARGVYLYYLSQLLKESLAAPIDPNVPVDPQIAANERLWHEGRRDEWFAAELIRWKSITIRQNPG